MFSNRIHILIALVAEQWFFFSRNIGQVTPKIIYFHYLKNSFLDQSIQKIFYLILKTEALVAEVTGWNAAVF